MSLYCEIVTANLNAVTSVVVLTFSYITAFLLRPSACLVSVSSRKAILFKYLLAIGMAMYFLKLPFLDVHFKMRELLRSCQVFPGTI